MKIQQTYKIRREDVPEAPEWLNKIIDPINSFFEDINKLVNKNISNSDNINCEIKEFTLSTTDFPYDFNTKLIPQLVTIGFIEQVADYHVALSAAITLDWTYQNGVITIENIIGLTAGKYKIRLKVE